jgi:hypothetical protein
VRPDDEPREQISEDDGLAELLKDDRRDGGDAEDERQVLKEAMGVVHGVE